MLRIFIVPVLFLSVGSLFPVFCFLSGGAAAVCTGYICLFLGFCLHFLVFALVGLCRTEYYPSSCNYLIYIVHVF